jgi:replicative DNA helicase
MQHDLLAMPDAQRTVLAAIITQPTLASEALAAGLQPSHLRRDEASIWQIIADLHQAGDPINVDTIGLLIRGAATVPPSIWAEIEDTAASWPGSKLVFQNALNAVLLEASRKAMSARLSAALAAVTDAENTEDLQQAASNVSEHLRQSIAGAGPIPVTADQIAAKLKERALTPARRIPTGIRKLDHILGGGLDKGRMYSLIGRYKIGKTTLMATLGYNIAYGENGDTPRKVAMISLERDEIDIEMLNAARALGINQRELDRHFKRHQAAFEEYARSPDRQNILYHHSPGANLEEVCAAIENAKRIHGIEAAFVDYYQVIYGNRTIRLVDHLSSVDRTLSILAADLNIALVLAAQADGDGLPRDCKALLHSAAANFSIRRPIDQPDAWLENLASNYIETRDAGDPQDGAIRLITSSGPYFESL